MDVLRLLQRLQQMASRLCETCKAIVLHVMLDAKMVSCYCQTSCRLMPTFKIHVFQ